MESELNKFVNILNELHIAYSTKKENKGNTIIDTISLPELPLHINFRFEDELFMFYYILRKD